MEEKALLSASSTGTGQTSPHSEIADKAEFHPLGMVTDPAELLPQLLDQLAALGEVARQISRSLSGNGQRAEATAEILKALTISRNGGGDQ